MILNLMYNEDARHAFSVDSVEHIQICGADGAPLLDLRGKQVSSMFETNVRQCRLQLGHLRSIAVLGYALHNDGTWAGIVVSAGDAAKVANYLRKRGWQVEAGIDKYCAIWRLGMVFLSKDFEV